VHRPDEQAQRVDAGQRDAGEGDDRDDDLGVEDAEQDQELADEVRGAGHREVRERDDQEQRRQHRRAERDAAHVADVLRAAGARGQQRDDEERGATTSPWLNACRIAPCGALVVEGEDPERDEAELGDRRVAEDQRASVVEKAITEP
jgi:hypothetical protein